MADRFETVIDKFVADTQEKMLVVVKQSISDVVEDAQTPIAKGGKMRVKTGFLRHSGTATLNALPRGQSRGDKNMTYTWDGDFINVVLAKMKIGDTFYFGWTAHYAKYREAYDGFLESALQKWQSFVDKNVRELNK